MENDCLWQAFPQQVSSLTEAQCMYWSNSQERPQGRTSWPLWNGPLVKPSHHTFLRRQSANTELLIFGLETRTDTLAVTVVLRDILLPVLMDPRPRLLVKFLPGINCICARITCLCGAQNKDIGFKMSIKKCVSEKQVLAPIRHPWPWMAICKMGTFYNVLLSIKWFRVLFC